MNPTFSDSILDFISFLIGLVVHQEGWFLFLNLEKSHKVLQ